MNYEEIQSAASLIAYKASNLYNKKPAEIEGSFTMYSHDRFSSLIIQGIAQKMLERGSTEEHIKDVLASKHIRWMLDNKEDFLIEIGKMLASEYGLSEVMIQK